MRVRGRVRQMCSTTTSRHQPVPGRLRRHIARAITPIIALALVPALAPLSPPARAAAGEVTFVASASTAGNRTAHVVRVPASVQAGDVLLLSLTTNSTTSTITEPDAGWTSIAARDGDGIRARLWRRTATATDANANVTVTTSAAAKSVIAVSAYRSTGTVPAVLALAGGADTAGTAHVAPAITVAGPGSWLVSMWAEKSSTDTSWTLPANVTARGSGAGTGSGKISATWGDSAGAVPTGSTAPRTATTSTSVSRSATFSVVIGPGDLPDNPPHAEFTASCSGLVCSFDASGSSDPDGDTHLDLRRRQQRDRPGTAAHLRRRRAAHRHADRRRRHAPGRHDPAGQP